MDEQTFLKEQMVSLFEVKLHFADENEKELTKLIDLSKVNFYRAMDFVEMLSHCKQYFHMDHPVIIIRNMSALYDPECGVVGTDEGCFGYPFRFDVFLIEEVKIGGVRLCVDCESAIFNDLHTLIQSLLKTACLECEDAIRVLGLTLKLRQPIQDTTDVYRSLALVQERIDQITNDLTAFRETIRSREVELTEQQDQLDQCSTLLFGTGHPLKPMRLYAILNSICQDASEADLFYLTPDQNAHLWHRSTGVTESLSEKEKQNILSQTTLFPYNGKTLQVKTVCTYSIE